MNVFLSYASEDRAVAEEIQLALLGNNHAVFFDKASLPAGANYYLQIEAAIKQADIYIFLISPNSVARGSYALTELKLARSKWPHPQERIVPVRLYDTPWEKIPPYLKSVTMLEPEGSPSAEILSAVNDISLGARSYLRIRLLRSARSKITSKISSLKSKGKIFWLISFAWGGMFSVAGLGFFVFLENKISVEVPSVWESTSKGVPRPLEDKISGQDHSLRKTESEDTAAQEHSTGTDELDAQKSAFEILSSLHADQYDKLWDSQAGVFFKSINTKESFIANMLIGRQFGKPLESSRLIQMTYSKREPVLGIVGEIYSFTFLTSYINGGVYQRIIVVKEKDGKFRMAFFWEVPRPKDF